MKSSVYSANRHMRVDESLLSRVILIVLHVQFKKYFLYKKSTYIYGSAYTVQLIALVNKWALNFAIFPMYHKKLYVPNVFGIPGMSLVKAILKKNYFMIKGLYFQRQYWLDYMELSLVSKVGDKLGRYNKVEQSLLKQLCFFRLFYHKALLLFFYF